MGEEITLAGNPLAYIMTWFDEVNLPNGHGNGPFILEWHEMKAYAESTGQFIRDWEFKLLRELSEAYCEVYEKKLKLLRELPPGMKQIDMKNPAAVKALFSKQGTTKKSKGKS